VKPNKAKAGGTFIEREAYQSRAFNSLSKNGMKVMIAFWDQRIFKKIKGKKSQCINADHLKLPYGLLQRTYGIPRGRIPKAIDELLANGCPIIALCICLVYNLSLDRSITKPLPSGQTDANQSLAEEGR
jgi:hypothetical protein